VGSATYRTHSDPVTPEFHMLRALLALVFLASAAVAADADADRMALQGTWLLDKAILGGRDHTDDFQGMKLILAENKVTVDFAENTTKGTFSLDAKKSPTQIDIKCETGPFKNKTLPGIYELKGDTLTLCLEADGKADMRPEKFQAPEMTRYMLLTYKRKKQ
jgi:uncharacterized protein (TIGR03067 family)